MNPCYSCSMRFNFFLLFIVLIWSRTQVKWYPKLLCAWKILHKSLVVVMYIFNIFCGNIILWAFILLTFSHVSMQYWSPNRYHRSWQDFVQRKSMATALCYLPKTMSKLKDIKCHTQILPDATWLRKDFNKASRRIFDSNLDSSMADMKSTYRLTTL